MTLTVLDQKTSLSVDYASVKRPTKIRSKKCALKKTTLLCVVAVVTVDVELASVTKVSFDRFANKFTR